MTPAPGTPLGGERAAVGQFSVVVPYLSGPQARPAGNMVMADPAASAPPPRHRYPVLVAWQARMPITQAGRALQDCAPMSTRISSESFPVDLHRTGYGRTTWSPAASAANWLVGAATAAFTAPALPLLSLQDHPRSSPKQARMLMSPRCSPVCRA